MVVGLILSYAVVFIIVALMIALWVIMGYIYWNRRRYAHIPSVPAPSFLFGHKKYFDKAMSGEDDYFVDRLIYDWYKQTGSRVIVAHALHFTMVVILDPKAVKDIMLDKVHTKPLDFIRNLRDLCGQRFLRRGILTEFDYDEWHKRRTILNKAFHRRSLKDFMEQFNSSSELLLEKLSEKADGTTPVCMGDELNRVTLDVICKVAFDLDLGVIENEDNFFNQAIWTALEGIMEVSQMSRKSFSSSYKAEVKSAIMTMRDTGRECLNKRIDEMNSGKEVREDILTYIIKSSEEVKGDDKEKMEVMIDEFVLFFFAGQETTANLLAFAFLALGQHPKVLKKLRQEVEEVVGDKVNVTFDDTNKLEYMTLVLKETLRLWPPVTAVSRQLSHDVNVDGYKIPAGTACNFNSYVMCRMEEYFQDPDKFDPERFRRDEDTTMYTYIPFSLGPKSCIGQQFAMIEARVILSKFLRRFQFQLVPGQKFTVLQKTTLRPKEKCMLYLTDMQRT